MGLLPHPFLMGTNTRLLPLEYISIKIKRFILYVITRPISGQLPIEHLTTCVRSGWLLIHHLLILAGDTGVEPAPNCVTGRHLNRLTYRPKISNLKQVFEQTLTLYIIDW